MFTKKDSLALKGIAILLMLWHHCFLPGEFDNYTLSFWPLSEGRVTNIAIFCKICVCIFAFISGYGLYTSLKNRDSGLSVGRWTKNRLITTLSGFWVVVVLSWIICELINSRTSIIYFKDVSPLTGIWRMLMEFLGLSRTTTGVMLNSTWWYMSAAVIFVFMAPLIYRLLHSAGSFYTVLALFLIPLLLQTSYPGDVAPLSFLPVFAMGMVFAQSDLFSRWDAFTPLKNSKNASAVIKFFISALALYLSYHLYLDLPTESFWNVKYTLIPLVFILFVRSYIITIPVLRRILCFLGKHSANIFMVHTFLRVLYAKDFIYSSGHGLMVYLTLLLCSLLISILIEGFKKLVRYDKLIKRLLQA